MKRLLPLLLPLLAHAADHPDLPPEAAVARALAGHPAVMAAEAGLAVRLDAAANLFGRLEGSEPDRLVVMLGSHSDSVPSGGRFDGPAARRDHVRRLAALARPGPRPRRPPAGAPGKGRPAAPASAAGQLDGGSHRPRRGRQARSRRTADAELDDQFAFRRELRAGFESPIQEGCDEFTGDGLGKRFVRDTVNFHMRLVWWSDHYAFIIGTSQFILHGTSVLYKQKDGSC